MNEKSTSRTSEVLEKIKALEVGETISFPSSWMSIVRAQAYKVSAVLGGIRATRLVAPEKLIYVTRIK